jgi:hypothetical protein
VHVTSARATSREEGPEKGTNPFRSFSDIGMPAREPDGTNRKVFPSKMAEAEEIRSRIETIKDLSDRLAEQDRTIKDLEEEMRSETPEHPWSFMKMRRHNRLHTEIEDEQTSMSRDRYDLNHLAERLFEDVNIIADKATSTNSLELILDLVEQSLDTDPKYRENVRKQAGVTDGMSYMRLVPQDNPKGMLPPTPWGRKAAEEAYRQHQVRQLDQRLRLLRTLATGSYKNHDTPETNDYLALMDFNVGDQVTMGPGLSTTVTTPHWLGGRGNPPRHRRRLPRSADGRQQGRRAQRKRGVPPGPNALHRFGGNDGRHLSGQEIRTNLPARRRFGRDSRSEAGTSGIPKHPIECSAAGPGHRPGRGGERTGQSRTRIMRTNETSGNQRKASDGRELREFWTRAKRHMSRRDFEKLRFAAIIRQ